MPSINLVECYFVIFLQFVNFNSEYLSLNLKSWPTILHGRIWYILEADSKRPICAKKVNDIAIWENVKF